MVPVGAAAVDPDDEDTLHPEDNVRLPDEVLAAPPAEVTMVVSAAEVARALEQPQSEPPAAQQQAPDLTVQHPPVGPRAETAETDTEREAEPDEEEVEKASPLRIAIALLVIVVLAALIVLLVLNALPR